MMLLTGPVIGAASGIVLGLFAFIASKLVRHCFSFLFKQIAVAGRRPQQPPSIPATPSSRSGQIARRGVVPVTYSAPSACATVHASWRRCFPCGLFRLPCHSTPRPDRVATTALTSPPTRRSRASRAPRRPSTQAPHFAGPDLRPAQPNEHRFHPPLPSSGLHFRQPHLRSTTIPGPRPPAFQQDFRKTRAPHPGGS